jgi:Restriction endonuclease BglII
LFAGYFSDSSLLLSGVCMGLALDNEDPTGETMLDQLREKGFEVLFESHATAILEKDFPSALGEIEAALLNFEIPITEIIGSGGGETKGTQRLRRALNALGWRKVNFEIKKSIRFSEADSTAEPMHFERESTTHEIDHVKAFAGEFDGNKMIALEIEWNNKDPFFDRDLENFKRLHAEGAISVGVIITRGSSLHSEVWNFVHRYATEQDITSFADLDRLNIGITPKQKASIAKRVNRELNPIDFPTAWADKFVGDKFGEATTHWSKLAARIDRGVGNPCPLLLIGLPASIVTFNGETVEAVEAEGEAEPEE